MRPGDPRLVAFTFIGVPPMRLLFILLGLSLVACDESRAPGGGSPAPGSPTRPDEDEGPAPSNGGADGAIAIPYAARFTPDGAYKLDPALPLPFIRQPAMRVAKGDQYDNRRAAAPQNFAITAPPERIGTVRPMVEWEPMQAIVFAYPSWAAQYANTSATFVNVAKTASDHGEVWVIVDSSSAETALRQRLTQAGVPSSKFGREIRFWRSTFDSYWLVDFGPLPLVDRATETYAFADFRYYHERPADDAVPTLLGRNLERFGAPNPATVYRMPLTTEGGTFQATTDGLCFTSSRQIYNMSCNTGTCRENILELSLDALQTHQHTLEMETVLQRYAGCRDLIVTHSVTDDGTGHIDMYMKVLDDDRILMGEYRPPFALTVQRENAGLMNDNAAFLEAYLVDGEPRFQVIRMPMPGHQRVEDFWGDYDVPFTFINSTFFNGVNLWPVYTGVTAWQGVQAESQAIWEQVLPDMEHVAIDSEELAFQSGAIHCVTRTIPRLAPARWIEDGACTDGVCGGVDGGYDGQCQLGVNGNLCFGPDWLCGCNDCRDCPASTGTACNGVSWRGCCSGGDVLYCENNQLKSLACGGTGCGWSGAEGIYNCGLSGVDPSGQNPAECTCTPQCDGLTCGSDGCGGTCGTCEGEDLCVDGVCRGDCVACTPGDTGCDGETSWLCVAGTSGCNTEQRVDCAASGLVCEAGQCDSPSAPDPDPQAEVAEPMPDTVDDDTTPDDDGGDAGDSGPNDEVGAEVKPTGVRDDGCGGGGLLHFTPLGLALIAWRGRRRHG